MQTEQLQKVDPRLERAVKDMDDALGLRWDTFANKWIVTYRWPQADNRWSRVQSGEINPEDAFDILAYLPADCAPEEAGNYVEKTCSEYARSGRIDVGRVLDRVHTHNDRQREKNLSPLVEYTEEAIRASFPTLFPGSGVIKPVYQFNPSLRKVKK